MLFIYGKEQYNGMCDFGCDWQFEEFHHANTDLSRVQLGER